MRRSKLLNGVNMKIAAATSVVIFTLLVSFVGVYAWFTAVRNIDNDTTDFKVENVGAAVDLIEFHDFDSFETISTKKYYKFKNATMGTVEVSGYSATVSGAVNMKQYKTYDPHQPILMLMRISSSVINIKLHTENEYITTSNKINADGNPLSSITEFHSVPFSKTDGDPTSLATRQAISKNYISVLESDVEANRSSFVTISNGEKTAYAKDVDIYSGSTDAYAYIGIVIDYYPESLEYIYSYFMGKDVLSTIGGVKFSCDWGMSV